MPPGARNLAVVQNRIQEPRSFMHFTGDRAGLDAENGLLHFRQRRVENGERVSRTRAPVRPRSLRDRSNGISPLIGPHTHLTHLSRVHLIIGARLRFRRKIFREWIRR